MIAGCHNHQPNLTGLGGQHFGDHQDMQQQCETQ